MLKVCVIFVLMSAQPAHAILDFVGEQVKDAAEAAAVTGAITDLIGTVDPDSAPTAANAEIQKDAQQHQKELAEAKYLDNETKQMMKGPDLSSKRLEASLKNTTSYINRTKRLLTKIGVLSPAATTAVNTAETNSQLNDLNQNQQTLILIAERERIQREKKELAERKSWEEFIQREKAVRQGKK
jgi:hypothetical protein